MIKRFVDRELFSVIAFTDSQIEHLWSDPVSQVTSAWIHVRGALYPALLYVSENYGRDLKYNPMLPQTERQLYVMPNAESKTSEFSRQDVRKPIIRCYKSRQMEEMLDSLKENGMFVCWCENLLYLLPVVSDVLQKGTFGIVLGPVASERGTYKRWGWFEGSVLFDTGSSFKALDSDERKKGSFT